MPIDKQVYDATAVPYECNIVLEPDTEFEQNRSVSSVLIYRALFEDFVFVEGYMTWSVGVKSTLPRPTSFLLVLMPGTMYISTIIPINNFV